MMLSACAPLCVAQFLATKIYDVCQFCWFYRLISLHRYQFSIQNIHSSCFILAHFPFITLYDSTLKGCSRPTFIQLLRSVTAYVVPHAMFFWETFKARFTCWSLGGGTGRKVLCWLSVPADWYNNVFPSQLFIAKLGFVGKLYQIS